MDRNIEQAFVVRYLASRGGEVESGNFDFCYAEEGNAEEAMLRDADETLRQWSMLPEYAPHKVSLARGEPNDDGHHEFCEVKADNGDFYRWWVDKLPLMPGE